MNNISFYKYLLELAIITNVARVVLPPVRDKATAVRAANYIRQWGFKCTVKNELNFCFWVEVNIK